MMKVQSLPLLKAWRRWEGFIGRFSTDWTPKHLADDQGKRRICVNQKNDVRNKNLITQKIVKRGMKSQWELPKHILINKFI